MQETTIIRDLFLKNKFGNEFEQEIGTWYISNLPSIEKYPNKSVMRAVIDAFIADCNMYAIKVVNSHDEWELLNKEAVINTKKRIELLLIDQEMKTSLPEYLDKLNQQKKSDNI